MEYVELHCHSNFSFLDGASSPGELVRLASALGYKALALTDHNGLYGIVRFNEEAIAKSIKPIFGSEITLETGFHLVLLVKNEIGYGNLCQLLTKAQFKGKKGKAFVCREDLIKHHEGLIALSGCSQGEIPSLLLEGEEDKAITAANYLKYLFGKDQFYLELQHHSLPVHEFLVDRLAWLGAKCRIPLVATNNVHYSLPDGRRLQDILCCIKNHVTLDEAVTLLYPNGERYLKSPTQMIKRFEKIPEAIENSVLISSLIDFTLDKLLATLPDFHVPDQHTSDSYLTLLTYQGAKDRYGELTDRTQKQLEHELKVISNLDLSGFFLIVWDITRFCREKKIFCQGRGSAANSAVCYCLGITAVDPIRHELLFERFLSESRTEPPDIDVDIANNRREEAIQYVYNKYGRDHAAMVCEIISYRSRSAVRDVGKALGFSVDEVNKLSKVIGHRGTSDEIRQRLEGSNLNLKSKRVELLLELCHQIKGFPRHLGIHVGGMIISKKPLCQIVPIENATMPDRSVIQWDKDDCAAVGFIKIDLLGLGMLSLVDDAFQMIKENHQVEISPSGFTYDDPRVFDLICRAETVGVFQVESRAQMNTLPKLKPRCFYDLVVSVALIRPGPIQGKMVHPYLRRRNGEEAVSYPHRSLKPILKRTLGIPLFQEQGMQVAVVTAGFTPSEADELRRAMGHKRSKEKMDALADKLIVGMKKNGIKLEDAERIFAQLAAFADFGFAESHAASFALLVYVSAFLKVYYPAEFYCALLNCQPMGFYSPATVIYEGTRRGMRFHNICVARSKWDCTVEEGSVRLGFKQLKSFGAKYKDILERELHGGSFLSIKDFVFRTSLSIVALEQLAMTGAFECFGTTRRESLWQVLVLANRSSQELELESVISSRTDFPEMKTGERLAADFKGMSLSTGPHPMTLLRSELENEKIVKSSDLINCSDRSIAVVAGVVVIRQRPGTAKGFMFITLEDEFGFANIVVKPHQFKKHRETLLFYDALIVKGVVENSEGRVNLIGSTFRPLEIKSDSSTNEIKLKSRDFQ